MENSLHFGFEKHEDEEDRQTAEIKSATVEVKSLRRRLHHQPIEGAFPVSAPHDKALKEMYSHAEQRLLKSSHAKQMASKRRKQQAKKLDETMARRRVADEFNQWQRGEEAEAAEVRQVCVEHLLCHVDERRHHAREKDKERLARADGAVPHGGSSLLLALPIEVEVKRLALAKATASRVRSSDLDRARKQHEKSRKERLCEDEGFCESWGVVMERRQAQREAARAASLATCCTPGVGGGVAAEVAATARSGRASQAPDADSERLNAQRYALALERVAAARLRGESRQREMENGLGANAALQHRHRNEARTVEQELEHDRRAADVISELGLEQRRHEVETERAKNMTHHRELQVQIEERRRTGLGGFSRTP